MLEHLVKISEKSYDLLREEFNFLHEAIDQKLEELMDTDHEEEDIESETEEDRAFIDDDAEEQAASFYRTLDRENEDQSKNDHECVYDKPEDNRPEPKKKKVHPLKKLRDRFQEYLEELLVLSFNSGKYDFNVVKEFLFPVLVQNKGVQFAIIRNHNFVCLKTPHLRFLDVTNFLAPSFSYNKFLKVYECPQTKGFFPYEWLDSPPHEAFFSTLKNKNISEEDYQYCQQVWSTNNRQTFREFLIWYNNRDVQPFCKALENISASWKDKTIDMLRQGISIPRVTLTYPFTTLESGIFFSLFVEKNKDLYYLFQKNMAGGPSIIFHRYHEAGKTKIRGKEMEDQGKQAKTCQKPMLYIYGPSCKTCPPDHLQDAEWKLASKEKVLPGWQPSG